MMLRQKLLKTWAQSYLAGVPRIIFGFRDDQGILRGIETMTTESILDRSECKRHWNPDTCLLFAEELVKFLIANVQEDDREVVYRLQKKGGMITFRLEDPQDRNPFLPTWYR